MLSSLCVILFAHLLIVRWVCIIDNAVNAVKMIITK